MSGSESMSIVSEIIQVGGYERLIEDQFIKVTKFTRPQTRINVKGIICHWTGNIGYGSNAQANRNFFNNRNDGNYGSAHICLDKDKIIGCLPYMPIDAEMAYHVGGSVYYTDHFGEYPNGETLGIEISVNKDGDFRESYKKAIWMTSHLCFVHNLNPAEDVMNHYMITRKHCPLPMLDLIFDDKFCKGIGFSVEDTKWMRDNLHVDGIQGDALWQKYLSDVIELTENLKTNNGVLIGLNKEDDNMNKVLEYDQWAWDELDVYLGNAYNDQIIEDWKWVQAARDKTLTYKDLLLVKILIDERRRVAKLIN